MTQRERFLSLMCFGSVDRVPLMEVGVWEETFERWHDEGLPRWKPSKRFPYHFGGYGKIKGMTAQRPIGDGIPFVAMADSLGLLLSQIHSFPEAEAVRLGVTKLDMEGESQKIRSEALKNFRWLKKAAGAKDCIIEAALHLLTVLTQRTRAKRMKQS